MKMHLKTSSGYLNAIKSSFVVFIITIIIIIINVATTKTNNSYKSSNTSSKMNTTKSVDINTLKISSSSNSTFPTLHFNSSTKMEILLENKTVMISATSSTFKAHQQEQQKANYNLDSVTAAATISDDSVKKNVATNFMYTIDAITSGGNMTTNVSAAASAVASLNNNENVVIVVLDGNNDTNDDVAHDDDNNAVHNSFYDKINKSNQQNEFNERLETTTAIPIFSTLSPPPSSVSASSLPSTTVEHEDALSTSFENAESQEYMMMLYPQQQEQQHKQYQKLLLHRQKRYLVFPEGSSFQLVFDLIIPIIDYTNFAIMGITCAVAWELPSKPPSEIIENLREKLNEGTLGFSRRNDSQINIQYIDSKMNDGGTVPSRDYTNNAQIPATVVATTSAVTNDENENRKALLTSAGAPAISYYDFYKNKPLITTTKTTQFNPYTQTQQQQYAFDAPSNAPFSYYSSSVPASSEDQTHNYFNGDSDNNINGKATSVNGNNNNMNEYATSNSYSKYNENTNGDSGTSGYAMNTKDKLKFTDWHQQPWAHKYEGEHEFEGKNKYYQREQKLQQQQQKLQQQEQQQAQQKIKYAGWDKNNWWQHNKHRIQNNWREKQGDWLKYENGNASPPPPPPQKSLGSTTTNARIGRYRKILQMPPKHRVYPVFGKRRRRRSEHRDADAFELKLELIHLREQLQTRQKLYGKIEKLYKVRGHNGTACVLRALCETGQRQHQTEPQTFITELLRAIFILPKGLRSSHSHSRSNRRNNSDMNVQQQQSKSKLKPKLQLKLKPGDIKLEQLNAYIERHYWEAAQQHAHDDGGSNCAQRFAMCEHSIWSDFDI